MRSFLIKLIIALSGTVIIGFHIWMPSMFLFSAIAIATYFISKIESIPWALIVYSSAAIVLTAFIGYLLYIDVVLTSITLVGLGILYFLIQYRHLLVVKIIWYIIFSSLAILMIFYSAKFFLEYPIVGLVILITMIFEFIVFSYSKLYERLNLRGFYFFVPLYGYYLFQSQLNRKSIFKLVTLWLSVLTGIIYNIFIITQGSNLSLSITILLACSLFLFVLAISIIRISDMFNVIKFLGANPLIIIGVILLPIVFIPFLAFSGKNQISS
jgi:hypothetical protein